jgi:hypothetical protein
MELDTLSLSTWDQLAAALPRSTTMAPTQQISFGKTVEPLVCICVSRDKAFHLLLEAPARTKAKLEIVRSAGLSVTTLTDHLVRYHGRQNLIDVKCTVRPHLQAFTSIATEIAELVLRDRMDAVVAVNQTIRKWKSFWGKPSSAMLGEEQQLGLIGEIATLQKLLGHLTSATAIEAWKGPLGFRHDFLFDKTALEVKATLSPARCHIINGIDQLQPVGNAKLHLVSLLASRIAKGGLSLVDAIRAITADLESQPAAYEVFQGRLAAAGYCPEHDPFYAETRFTLSESRVFEVRDDFPRLTSDMLKAPLSPRITTVRYVLNLEGLQSLSLSSWITRLSKQPRSK